MKAKNILATLLLMVAGLQTATAQRMVVRMADNTVTKFNVTQVVDVTFVEETADTHGTTNGHEWVDLGLPSGTLWATCNVGSNNPEEYGDYFAWGETTGRNNGKITFNYNTYKWYNGENITKYDSQEDYGVYSNPIIDNKTELDYVDDAATANWGCGWQMPSRDQIEELSNNHYTTTIGTVLNGVKGLLITSKSNGNSIFMPATGGYDSSPNDFTGIMGYYWSRSRNTSNSLSAYCLWIASEDGGGIGISSYSRCDGFSVRPVRTESNEYVDLGLPSGTLWAKCNIGASRPEGYGEYFAWGEIETKDYYDWSTYKWCKNETETPEKTLTKYCTQISYGSGRYEYTTGWYSYYDHTFTDGISQLLPEDDAATVNWGSNWRIPSVEQFSELWDSNNTTLTWTTQNSVYGVLVTSKNNGNTLFLPAAGNYYATSLYSAGSDGFYWTRQLNTDEPNNAYNIGFNSSNIGWNVNNRRFGMTVRPVRK